MNVEPDTTLAQPSVPVTGKAPDGSRDAAWMTSPIAVEILERLDTGSPRFIARAPGRLDVMGGLAEYTGALVLNMTTTEHACVGVQRRSDAKLTLSFSRSLRLDGQLPVAIAMSRLEAGGAPIGAQAGRQLLEGEGQETIRCVLGTIVEMRRAGLVTGLEGGLSVVVGSSLDALTDAGRDAALSAATLAAIARACKTTPDAGKAAAVCQAVENNWLLTPVGIGDAVCALVGEPQILAEIRCDPFTLAGSITLPRDLEVRGIDCGVVHPDSKRRYERVRTAAFMGQALINLILEHEEPGRACAYLSRITAADYVDRFRNRLPTKLKGQEYVERFGKLDDPLTRVDPGFTYKIRSRTEHHIYEHTRSCQFVEGLSRALRNRDERALGEVGELMYASHWSYGQRCGLGSVETDLLVNLIRDHGCGAGVYGAKITARGCGGTVAVLMRASEEANAAVEKAVSTYQAKTGNKTTMLRGSSEGALVSGARQV